MRGEQLQAAPHISQQIGIRNRGHLRAEGTAAARALPLDNSRRVAYRLIRFAP